mgnify:CR=1 FL=1
MNNEIKEYTGLMDTVRFTSAQKTNILSGLKAEMNGETPEEETKMIKWNIKKTIAAAALIVAASGGAVYAAGHIVTTYGGASPLDYKYSYAQADDMKKKAGITAASIPEDLGNGYVYDVGAVLTTYGADENGNKVDEWTEIDVHYVNADGDVINLMIEDEANFNVDTVNAQENRTYAGTDVYASVDTYLFLPPNYEEAGLLSDEILERMENDPHFEVSYGSDTEQTTEFTNVSFVKDGVGYLLYAHDAALSTDDFFDMAEVIIGK